MSRRWRSEAGGAAQPTLTPGGAAQPTFSALSDDASELTAAFYNVGIQLSCVGAKNWAKTKEKQLAADIVKAAKAHALDILCLSELGELGVGIGEKLPERDVSAWIRKLLADSAVSPVAIYADGHYATLVLSDRVQVLQYQIIRDFVETQRDRCFQHFRVRRNERDQPISIIHCHAPSSNKRPLRAATRLKYFTAFHKACADDPFIWGGDFNTGLIELTALLEGIADRYIMDPNAAQPGSLQTLFSHPVNFKHGDFAVTFNLCSAQVTSEVGASFRGTSDAHDVVVAKVFLPSSSSSSATQPARNEPAGSARPPPPKQSSALLAGGRAHWPMAWPTPPGPAPWPQRKASSSISAAQPAAQQPAGSAVPLPPQQSSALHGAGRPKTPMAWPMRTRPAPQPEAQASSASSAAQPAPQKSAGNALPPPPQQSFALHRAERPERPMAWPMRTRPAPQPETQASSASSAAEPARQESAGSALPPPPQQSFALHGAERPERPIAWPMSTRPALPPARPVSASSAVQGSEWRPTLRATRPEAAASSASSAAQPARQEPADSAQPPRHHRVNAVFGTDDPSMAPLQKVLEQIGTEFLFGKVANIVASSTGCYEVASVPCIVQKLESFLEIIEEQRSRHLGRHPSLLSDAVFTHEDMLEIHRTWMEDHESWMNAETIRKYNSYLQGRHKGDRQTAHKIRHSAFSAFLFQIIGNKPVLLASIQHPICSAAEPANVIERFMRAWDEEKASEDYKKRRQISERLTTERKALKDAAHAARQALVRGRKIHAAILRGSNQRAALSGEDIALLDDFNSGKLERDREECDAAFGWNKDMRTAAGSAADKIGR